MNRIVLPLFVGLSGCASGARWDATPLPIQVEGVWLFEYTDTPRDAMHALLTADAAIEDGCLTVGEAVVTWVDAEIPELTEVVQRLQDGENVVVSVGGGGSSLDEGALLEDWPEAIVDRCNPRALWSAGSEPILDEEPRARSTSKL